jgi:hypothetical protein
MSDDERKPRLHINIGVLIILIIIVLLLFKVDIKSKIKSEQFQSNITYVETTVKDFWNKYIVTPFKSKAGEVFIDATNEGVKKIQTGFTENVLKTTDTKTTTQ